MGAASAAEATATLATATWVATATVLATALATALTTPTVTADTIPATAEDLVPKKADLSAVTSSAAADRTSGEKLNQDHQFQCWKLDQGLCAIFTFNLVFKTLSKKKKKKKKKKVLALIPLL